MQRNGQLNIAQAGRNMNRTQIKKNIAQTIFSWTESIVDYPLRTSVRQDLVVSGGCIASMLLDQPVQDYDIYFRTPAIAKALAKYYLGVAGLIDNGMWDGGVLVDGNSVTVDGAPYYVELKSCSSGFTPLYFSKNAITLSGGIQLVLRFCGNIESVHKTFDFVHSKNYYADGELVLDQFSLESILAKELHYVGSGFPVSALYRVFKFTKRGWKIPPGELMKICYDISKLDLDDPSVIEDQLGGVYGSRAAKELEKFSRLTRADFFAVMEGYTPVNPAHDGNYK